MKNKYKVIVMVLILILSGFSYYLILDRLNTNRIGMLYLNFQDKYQAYIDQEDKLKAQDIKTISDDSFLKTNALKDYYDDIKDVALKKFNEEYLKYLYQYNFLKTENMSTYDTDLRNEYQNIIRNNDVLIFGIEKQHDVEKLNLFKENVQRLLTLSRFQYQQLSKVQQVFSDGLNNKGTKITLEDDCFTKQINNDWQIDDKLSVEYCNFLKLDNCFNKYEYLRDNNKLSYTLNNPQAISKTNAFSYVSYYARDFIKQDRAFKQNMIAYPEVFVRNVKGINIYKFNIIEINKDYQLSCALPNN
ncbi:MAG: hypothetical protein LBT75_04230 [Bacilli bacterium]|jgi:hypothetical protein|nr:hypothetical protein [Bacilli bacterium]